jgi:hypothetical protein
MMYLYFACFVREIPLRVRQPVIIGRTIVNEDSRDDGVNIEVVAVTTGVRPPVTVTLAPRGVRRCSPGFRAAALTQLSWDRSQNRWFRVVWMTAVPCPALMVTL